MCLKVLFCFHCGIYQAELSQPEEMAKYSRMKLGAAGKMLPNHAILQQAQSHKAKHKLREECLDLSLNKCLKVLFCFHCEIYQAELSQTEDIAIVSLIGVKP